MDEKGIKHTQVFWIVTVIVSAAVLSVMAIYFSSETVKERPNDQAKLVKTMPAVKSDEKVVTTAFGTVQAERELTLRSEVSGRVIKQSPNLVVGGIISKGEMLLQLDPRDYINTIEQEKAALERANFELKVEEGRQVVAKREWEQLSLTIKTTELSEFLALRKPHLKEKQAAFAAAKSRLEKAELDLERTTTLSPMDAVVITEAIEVGDYVTPQTEIARIVATDAFRVQVSVPVNKLNWIKMPQNGNPGSHVSVIHDVGGREVKREASILRMLGNLDPSGRMARILIEVKDPIGLENPVQFPLLIGTYTQVEFEGPIQKGIYVLPREALRENSQVWVKNNEGVLEVRDVNVVLKKEKEVYVNEGINEGDQVIVSRLTLAIPGMKIRTLDEEEESAE